MITWLIVSETNKQTIFIKICWTTQVLTCTRVSFLTHHGAPSYIFSSDRGCIGQFRFLLEPAAGTICHGWGKLRGCLLDSYCCCFFFKRALSIWKLWIFYNMHHDRKDWLFWYLRKNVVTDFWFWFAFAVITLHPCFRTCQVAILVHLSFEKVCTGAVLSQCMSHEQHIHTELNLEPLSLYL